MCLQSSVGRERNPGPIGTRETIRAGTSGTTTGTYCETGWARISWDDPRVKEFDVSVAFESVIDPVAMGIKISEWYEIEDPYDDEHKLKLSDFPKKLRPYVEDWLSSAF